MGFSLCGFARRLWAKSSGASADKIILKEPERIRSETSELCQERFRELPISTRSVRQADLRAARAIYSGMAGPLERNQRFSTRLIRLLMGLRTAWELPA